MEASLEVLVAFPSLPHLSHLYPESRCSLLMNLSSAWVTSARGMFVVGDVDRDADIDAPPPPRERPAWGGLPSDDDRTGRMSSPMSSMGSILVDVERHAEHVTFDSTVPRKRRKGYSSSSPALLTLFDEDDEDGPLSAEAARAPLQLVCMASISSLRNSCESSCTPLRNQGATLDMNPETKASGTNGPSRAVAAQSPPPSGGGARKASRQSSSSAAASSPSSASSGLEWTRPSRRSSSHSVQNS
jgi:hypothetical protein